MAAIAATTTIAQVRAAPVASAKAPVRAFVGLKKATALTPVPAKTFASKTVSNGAVVKCMEVVNPDINIKFETLSYLPPLSDNDIALQVDYIINNGWIPAIEFDREGFITRKNGIFSPCYYDNRYWTLWKLPLFGATNASLVLNEITNCKNAYPHSFIRVVAFDNIRQVQCVSFIVNKP